MDENTIITEETGIGAATPAQEEKKFSQAELDAIISRRLGHERAKIANEMKATYAEMEQVLAKREFTLHATETLKKNDLPVEIMDALDCSSKEAFDKAVSVIGKVMAERPRTSPPAGGAIGFNPSRTSPDTGIRQAMGLKK